MKKLFLLLLLTAGTTVMANTVDPEAGAVTETKKTIAVKTTVENAKAYSDITAPKKKNTATITAQPMADGSRFSISYYIVDFINRNNLKIVNCILND